MVKIRKITESKVTKPREQEKQKSMKSEGTNAGVKSEIARFDTSVSYNNELMLDDLYQNRDSNIPEIAEQYGNFDEFDKFLDIFLIPRKM